MQGSGRENLMATLLSVVGSLDELFRNSQNFRRTLWR
jgi:hypothetical protein